MSHVVTLSDTLHVQLQAEAHARGLSSVEQLIEQWQMGAVESQGRKEVVAQIDALRKRLSSTYDKMPDSVEMIRADRER